MSNRVSLSPRDLSLLQFLSWTPATTAQLLRVSDAFEGTRFLDERRLRERLQSLGGEGIVRAWSTAHAGGGLQNYYKLTPLGFDLSQGTEIQRPPRAFFIDVSPSLFEHTFRLAEVIVQVVRAAHASRVAIERFIRENELTFAVGESRVQPDGFFRLHASERPFNLAFEIDNSTEPIDSHAVNSLRTKVTVYDAYQEQMLAQWRAGDKAWERPRFRVVFLTRSVTRAYHILSLVAESTRHTTRRLVYAATFDSFVSESEPLHAPIFLDHVGVWQSLIDLHPTAAHRKEPVRLGRFVESRL
jgi:hypothetical protein